jgi:LytTr DNA-binding domain-containing protein
MTIAERRIADPAPRAKTPAGGDGEQADGTGGGLYGASGRERRLFWIGFAGYAAFTLCVDLVNIATVADDYADLGRSIPVWEPTVWELTSGASTILCLLAFYPVMIRLLARARGWPAVAIVHLGGLLVFSLAHVAGMVTLRHLIYQAIGDHYPLSLSEFPYELRKDSLSYAFAVGLFWLLLRTPAAEPAAPTEADPALFDIRDGTRILRTPVADIRAVSSAGNYVAFDLADGRKPLMRATLASIETALASHGFVRTHRSWLVNPAAVRAIEPEGSGDFALELDGGARVPLSRRFPEALKQLRG